MRRKKYKYKKRYKKKILKKRKQKGKDLVTVLFYTKTVEK